MDVIERTSVEVTGDSSEYNRSIDAAVAHTKRMIQSQQDMVKKLAQNEAQQQKTAKSIENNRKAMEKNSIALRNAVAKYGEKSKQVNKLLNEKKKLASTNKDLSDTAKELTKQQERFSKQLKSVNSYLDTQQKELKETDAAAQKTSKTMGNMTKLLIGLGTGYAGKSFLKATIGGIAEFEQYETSFAVMLGDMQKAKNLIGELKIFAAATPLGINDLTEATKVLLQFGVAEDDVMSTLKMLGDVSLGNKEKLNSLAVAFGQIQSTGKLTGQDLLQLINAGFNPLRVIADKTGKSVAQLKEEMSDGAISAQMVTDAFKTATSQGGQFYNALEEQSKTLTGLTSTLKDNISAIGRDIGTEAFDNVKNALKDTMNEVDRMKKNGEMEAITKGWGTAFAGITKSVMWCTTSMVKNREAVGMLVTSYGAMLIVQQLITIMKAYKAAVDATTTAQKLLTATMAVNPWVALAGAVAVVTGGILSFADATKQADKKLKELNEETRKIKAGNFDFGSEKVIELQRTIDSTLPSLEEYKTKVEKLGGVSKLSAGEQELLKQKIKDVNSVLGDEKVKIDGHTDSLVINTNELWENIEALKARAKAEAGYQLLVRKEQEYTEKSLEYEQKKIENNEKISKLKKEQEKVGYSLFGNKAGVIDDEIRNLVEENIFFDEHLESLSGNIDALTESLGEKLGELKEKFKEDSGEVFVPPPPTTFKEVKDILKEAYDEQLRIAKDYMTKRKQQIDEEYSYQKQKISDSFDGKISKLKKEYEAERDKVNKVIAEIDREIAAKQKAREEEKLGDEINLKTKQISILEQQIEFARNPEEKAELEKELKRQQETLKDLNVEVEVNKLEAEKQSHQERLKSIEEEHKQEIERLEGRKKKQLESLEEEHKKALENIDNASLRLRQQLSAVYGYIDSETVATGKRFADVTVNTLDSGFTTVATQAQAVIDDMMRQVENAIDSLNRAARKATRAKSDYEDERRRSYRSFNDYSDSRSMNVTNNVVQGLTESQVDRLMDRQARRFLYGR